MAPGVSIGTAAAPPPSTLANLFEAGLAALEAGKDFDAIEAALRDEQAAADAVMAAAADC